MPLEEVIAGFTGTGFATLPPTIPGLMALGIFGTGRDGKNTNRAAGGPAFVNLTNPPTYGTAWATVNSGAQTPTQGLDTGVAETTTVRDGGWTMFCVGRITGATGSGSLISTNASASSALILSPSFASLSNHAAIYMQQQGVAFVAASDSVDLGTTPAAANAWRMYAATFPAGAGARPYTVFDVTGARSTVTGTAATRSVTTNHFLFGANGAAVPAAFVAADLAVGGVCTQPLTLPQLQTVRTWLLGVLSPRGVTGF